ncbi:protein kinase [Actinomycetes bacterium KLBMP 9759]
MVDDRWLGVELAGYRIEALIGHGGAGVVYRATQMRLQRPAAVKLLAPGLASDTEFRLRFEREARLAARLEHPHIVPIYDSGFADGVLYMTMRYIDGPNLATTIDDSGPMQPHQVCELLIGIAEALDTAHHAGLVHRDVKPANVLLAASGRSTGGHHAYLCDFGIARHAAGGSTLTAAGQLMGALSYCAPEQLQGQHVDGRTDQYALACVAYFCLTGLAPFAAGEPAAVMFAHIFTSPPPASIHNPELPPAVDVVIARALAKQPTDRFGDCITFIHALAAAASPAAPPRAALLGRSMFITDETIIRPPSSEAVTTRIRHAPVAPTTRRRILRTLLVLGVPVLAVIVAVAALAVFGSEGTNNAASPPATARASPSTETALTLPISEPRLVDPCGLLRPEQFTGFGKISSGPMIGGYFRQCVLVLSLTAGGSARISVEFGQLIGGPIDARVEQPGGLRIKRLTASTPGCPRDILLSDQTTVGISVEVVDGSVDACAIADLGTSQAVRDLMERGVPYLPTVDADPSSLRYQHACNLLDDQTLRRIPDLDPARRFKGFAEWSCFWGRDSYPNGFQDSPILLDFQWITPRALRADEQQVQIGGRDVFFGPRTYRDNEVSCLATIFHRSRPFSNGAPAREIVTLSIYTDLPVVEQCQLVRELAAVVVSKLPTP